jgi:Nucleotidyltransferase domain.
MRETILPEEIRIMPVPATSVIPSSGISERVAVAVRHMQQTRGFEHVRFIILYGSAAENRMTKESDIDLCVYYEGRRTEAARFRHAVLSCLPGVDYDIQIFQDLPLYIRVEVIKGKPVFVRNLRFLYEKATETLRDFEDFKHRLYDYTGQDALR